LFWSFCIFLANDSDAYSLHPFSAKDLSIRNLADRLLDLPYLTKLYPDIDKNQAFGKYYTQPPSIYTFSIFRININLFFIINQVLLIVIHKVKLNYS